MKTPSITPWLASKESLPEALLILRTSKDHLATGFASWGSMHICLAIAEATEDLKNGGQISYYGAPYLSVILRGWVQDQLGDFSSYGGWLSGFEGYSVTDVQTGRHQWLGEMISYLEELRNATI